MPPAMISRMRRPCSTCPLRNARRIMRSSVASRRAYQLEIGSDAISLTTLELWYGQHRSSAEANSCKGEQNENHFGSGPVRGGADHCPGHGANHAAGGPGSG